MPNVLRAINKMKKVKWIDPVFPFFARTSTKTVIATGTYQPTLDGGFASLGMSRPGHYNDPFGTMSAIGIDDVKDSDSKYEAVGHDILGAIYGSYRVYSSTTVFRICCDPHLVTHAFTDTDGTTGSTSGTYALAAANINSPHRLVVIPSTEADLPASSWQEAIHHPFAYIKTIPAAKNANTVGNWVTLTVNMSDHAKFNKNFYRHSDTDQGQELEWTSIDSSPNVGQGVHLHVFILGLDGSYTTNSSFNMDIKCYQQVLLAKFTGDDTSAAVKLGDEYLPTVTA